ncbi:hypothetical protein A2U01_0075302, partial [Trifolium medium]|nr:hypothetical protein [Trifolium medium]
MDGSCIGAATKVIRARTATEVEALGLEAVLRFIDRYHGQTVIVEMDAKMVVQAVQKHAYPRAYWGKIAQRGGDLLLANPNV